MGRVRDAWRSLLGQPVARSFGPSDIWGPATNVNDLIVGVDGALSVVSLYAAIRLIADQLAATPLHGYRRLPNGTPQKFDNDPPILTPTGGRSIATWKTQVGMSLLTAGNAVGLYGSYGPDGWPTSTIWVDTAFVQCDDIDPANPRYWYMGRPLELGTFIHIPWLVMPGRAWGLSPLKMFKLVFETGMSAQQLAKNFNASGGVPSGHLKNNQREVSQPDAERTKAKFMAAVAGRQPLVTGNDWDYTAIGLPADELQFVQSLKLTATQIASIYGIAPEDIGGEAAAGLQYSTVEMNQIKLSTNTMRPWYTRIEDGLAASTPRGQYLKFDPDDLLRTDLVTRMNAHQLALGTGVEIQPEARAKEGKQPLTPEEFATWQKTYKPAPVAPAVTREGQQ
jgi:phage portal protein BeeE